MYGLFARLRFISVAVSNSHDNDDDYTDKHNEIMLLVEYNFFYIFLTKILQ